MTTQEKKKRLRNKCDRAYQEIGRMLYDKCIFPGCNEPYSCLHHFIAKSICSALRYNIKNGIPICNKHHLQIEFKKDSELTVIIKDIKGKEWFDELCAIRKNTFIKESIEYYEIVLKNLELIKPYKI